jgi:RNA polymerase sigma-70 factor (ECF subfamily)
LGCDVVFSADPPSPERVSADAIVRALLDAGDHRKACEAAYSVYGDEIGSFVRALLRSDDAAAEVCAQVWEDVWRGLPAFRAEATFRTWLYTIARHACSRFRTRNPEARQRPLSEARTSQLVYVERTRPTPTEARRHRFALLRSELSDDDRALLFLRVDRGLAWEDVARVLYTNDHDDALARHATVLRKRFERIKERLRARLREQEP